MSEESRDETLGDAPGYGSAEAAVPSFEETVEVSQDLSLSADPVFPEQNVADDLGEETSILDASFAAPHRPAAEEPRDVLSSRSETVVVADDGSVASVAEETQVLSEPSPQDDLENTGVMRRSLIDSAGPPQPTPTPAPAPAPVPAEAAAPAPLSHPLPRRSAQADLDSAVLEGATILPEVPSRQPSRWLSLFAFLLLTPIAWYLLADAGGRLLLADAAPWVTGRLNPAALLELAGGIAVLLLLGIVAAQSSFGLYVAGTITLLVGIPFLAVPTWTQNALEAYVSGPLSRLGALGDNAYYYLQFTGATGLYVTWGALMIITGWVVTRVRRKGRTEESLRVEVAERNPDGLKARWARKASGN